mgnify:CR=1 FL=1
MQRSWLIRPWHSGSVWHRGTQSLPDGVVVQRASAGHSALVLHSWLQTVNCCVWLTVTQRSGAAQLSAASDVFGVQYWPNCAL